MAWGWEGRERNKAQGLTSYGPVSHQMPSVKESKRITQT